MSLRNATEHALHDVDDARRREIARTQSDKFRREYIVALLALAV